MFFLNQKLWNHKADNFCIDHHSSLYARFYKLKSRLPCAPLARPHCRRVLRRRRLRSEVADGIQMSYWTGSCSTAGSSAARPSLRCSNNNTTFINKSIDYDSILMTNDPKIILNSNWAGGNFNQSEANAKDILIWEKFIFSLRIMILTFST